MAVNYTANYVFGAKVLEMISYIFGALNLKKEEKVIDETKEWVKNKQKWYIIIKG